MLSPNWEFCLKLVFPWTSFEETGTFDISENFTPKNKEHTEEEDDWEENSHTTS